MSNVYARLQESIAASNVTESTRVALARAVEEGRAAKARDRALRVRAERVAVSDLTPEAKRRELERIRQARMGNHERNMLRSILRSVNDQ